MGAGVIFIIVGIVFLLFVAWKSFHSVGAGEVGLVAKRFAFRKLAEDNPIAFRGEAGYQATLLMPGLRFKLWPMFGVKKFPWVQVPAGEIGVVIAQVGAPLPIGAKSAVYTPELATSPSVAQLRRAAAARRACNGRCCPPARSCRSTRSAFIVLTPQTVYGLPVSPDLAEQARSTGLTPESFGLSPEQLQVVVIAPDAGVDMVGIVTALEGEPLPSGDIASRLGGFDDVAAMEASKRREHDVTDAEIIDAAARQQERRCTTTTRTSRPSSTPAARSDCSTTRCSTAPTS